MASPAMLKHGIPALAVLALGCNPSRPSNPVMGMTISGLPQTLVLGSTTQLRAVVTLANGSTKTVNPVVWQSNDERVATVSASGELNGHARGAVEVTARFQASDGAAWMAS